MIIIRTTINISDSIVREADTLYKTKNRSQAIENTIEDAVRFHKLKQLMTLKSKISFDEEKIRALREMEKEEI